MPNAAVAWFREFVGWDEPLPGPDMSEDERYPTSDPTPQQNDPPGVYRLRNEREDFAGMAIVKASPRGIDEASQVAEQIKDQLPVIVNLEDVVDGEARRIVDFLSGVIYGLNGSMKKVARSVFICAPFDVPVDELSITPGRGVHEDDEETADVRHNAML